MILPPSLHESCKFERHRGEHGHGGSDAATADLATGRHRRAGHRAPRPRGASRGGGAPAIAAPTGFVTMSDGVQIAVNVRLPDSYVPGVRYPTIFEMSGYDGGSADGGTLARDVGVEAGAGRAGRRQPVADRALLRRIRHRPRIRARHRLLERRVRHLLLALRARRQGDHRQLDPEPGVVERRGGHRRPLLRRDHRVHGRGDPAHPPPGRLGLGADRRPVPGTGLPGRREQLRVPAALDRRHPARLRPRRRAAARDRPARGARRRPQPPGAVRANVAGKSRTVLNDPLLQGLQDTDNDWYRARSLITYVDEIRVPIHITGAHQDEQTGPRGPTHLYESIQGVPKRLVLTNGDHGTGSTAAGGLPEIRADRKAWLDHWVRGLNGGFGKRRADPHVGDHVLRGPPRRRWDARPERPARRHGLPVPADPMDRLVPPPRRVARHRVADGARGSGVVPVGLAPPVVVVPGRAERGPAGHDRRGPRRAQLPQRAARRGHRDRGADRGDALRAERHARHRAVRQRASTRGPTAASRTSSGACYA